MAVSNNQNNLLDNLTIIKNMDKNIKFKITLFYCINAFKEGKSLPLTGDENFEINFIKMACSSMVKDVFLLRAFEAGADAVVVLVCPEGQCRYVEGNLRAKKRVGWVKKLLDEIGIDGNRLSIFNISSKDKDKVPRIVQKIVSDLADLGPNPAK